MYYVTNMSYERGMKNGVTDEWEIIATEDANEAIQTARDYWERKTSYDKEHSKIEIREYVEDIEDENCECFDYNTLEWEEPEIED